MNKTFKAVIFDFGGVFTTSPVENFAIFERVHGLPERFIGGVIKSRLHDGAFARFERGEIALEEFDQLFAEETRKAGFEITGRTLAGLLDVALKPAMAEALRRIKVAGFATGCITNNFPALATYEKPERAAGFARIFANFDHLIESSKVGVRKPEPEIYRMMLEALSLPASACIFIDDLGINLKPAQAMGMTTIKAPFGDMTPAIDALAEHLSLPLR